MNSKNPTLFTAYIGIDWADRKHDVCIQCGQNKVKEFDQILHQPEQLDQWAQSLLHRFGAPIAIALELSKGPIVSALQKHAGFVIFPINPSTLARYRTTFTPSRAKDDPTDAELALDLILRHPQRFTPLSPQSTEIRTLISLVEQRRSLVNDRIRVTNRLRNALKQYYPQPLEWFDRIDTRVFCDFIERWPTLIQIKRARGATVTSFFHEHNVRFEHVIANRIASIKTATPLTTDEAVIMPYRLQALTLIDQLRLVIKAIKQYDTHIAELAPQHPDYSFFEALPGAGPTLAPRLLVAFGEQRDRFNSANELQCYAGIAPVTERSGKKHWVHWRWHSSTFLRQTFIEWAAQTINKSYWAGIYYKQQREKGSTYQVAVRALAFKWIRIVYRCWKDNIAYNESKYLKALKQR